MIEKGLVSISFRGETPRTIADAAARAGLSCIEWGADVHAVPGDADAARSVRRVTEDAGLHTAAYGSYYRLGTGGSDSDMQALLETAALLGAPVIRIWGGDKGSAKLTPDALREMEREARRFAELSADFGISVALECHNNTLTDNWRSAVSFIQNTDHPQLKLYWQPNQYQSVEYNLEAAAEIAPYLANVHVFNWEKKARYPLSEGIEVWKKYVKALGGQERALCFLLEFMPDGRLESLNGEADALAGIFV